MQPVIIIQSFREFLGLRGAWNQLAAQDADACLLGHDWFTQCWKCWSAAGRNEILALPDGAGGFAGFLALRRHPGPVRHLRFLDDQRSQRLDLLLRPGEEEALLESLAAHLRGRRDWDILDLNQLRADTAARIRARWPRHGLAARERGAVRQRQIALQRPWAEIEAGFSSYLRSNFRRRQKRLLARGALALRRAGTPGEIGPWLRACFALEAKGWKGQGGTAILDDPQLQRFYRQLAYRLAARGQFHLFCLTLDGEVIAFEYCVASGPGGRLSSLKIGYDEQHATASPGTVLRWMLLDAARAEFAAYDFLGGDASWKAEWTAAALSLSQLRIYNRTWRGQALRARAEAFQAYRRWRPAPTAVIAG